MHVVSDETNRDKGYCFFLHIIYIWREFAKLRAYFPKGHSQFASLFRSYCLYYSCPFLKRSWKY